MSRRLLLTDIDNTLYDWPKFFAPSFRAMLHVLSRELEAPEEQLYAEAKEIFARHQSLEYAFIIQELPTVRRLGRETDGELIRIGRGTFRSVQAVRLKPYPGVKETLDWLRFQDVTVVGVTNSPVWRAQQRLYDLNLDSVIDGLIAWEGFAASTDDPATLGYASVGPTRKRSRLRRVWTAALGECKPNEKHYSLVLDALHVDPADAWAIGDSLAKDLEPAARLGIRTIWARYGSAFDPTDRDMETLLRITHWNPERIDTTYLKNDFVPDAIVDRFDEVKQFFPEIHLSLF